MSEPISIRAETPEDYAGIQHVNDLAFDRPNEGKLVEKLRQRPEFDPRLSLVAELDGKIVGHALFLPVQVQDKTGNLFPCLSLGPIAVIPDRQNQGIGGQLIEAGHHTATALDYTAVVLLGHPGYYPRFGYRMAKLWGLTNPWGIDDEPWMAIELIEGALHNKAGIVRYPPAFNEAT